MGAFRRSLNKNQSHSLDMLRFAESSLHSTQDHLKRRSILFSHRCNEDELIVRERRLEHDALVRILASLAARYEKELQISELPDAEKTKDFQAPFSPFSFAEAMQLFGRSNSLNNSKKLDLWKNIAGIEGDKFCKL